jgi:hypothetical protein
VVSASKLGAMLPKRNLRTSELSSHAEATRMRSTYGGGRSEVEVILKRFLGLISRIWRGMRWGKIKVDGIFEDTKKEEASWLFEAATWWSFCKARPPVGAPFLLSKHDKPFEHAILVFSHNWLAKTVAKIGLAPLLRGSVRRRNKQTRPSNSPS